MIDTDKFKESIENLQQALRHLEEARTNKFAFAGLSKTFEVCFEYTWKYLKKILNESGVEVYAPRDVIKTAGRTELLDNVEIWLDFLNKRNLAVHDYIGIDDPDYLELIVKFFEEVQRINIIGD